jgi:hypothetical protein
MSAISITDAMNAPKLFAPHFAGSSWDQWKAVLKATFAEPMSDDERKAFAAVAEREPPKRRVSEAVYIVGRGGGKDSVASLIAAYIAMSFEPKGRLRAGEKAVVMLLAVDRQQASIVFGYIAGLFTEIAALAALVKNIGAESIELRNSVVIEVHTNSYRSVRGRSIVCAIFDECAFWRDENSATPDVETAGAVQPGLARLPGSMLVVISTPHRRSGLLYQKWKDHYGRNDDDVLVVRGSTLQFNATFDAAVIARQVESDPALYGSEYPAEWRDDLSSYIGRELLEAAVDRGVVVRPPAAGNRYHAFADPSGGAHDSFTMGIAHREKDNTVLLDMVFEKRPPFNPSETTEEIAALLKTYGLSQITGDRYAAQWVVEAFRKVGIKYLQSERDRSQIYLDTLPLFTAGRARLIDSPRLVSQFSALERRTFSTGRDRVDHGRTGHDDLCNAAAGALVLASRRAAYDSSYAWVLGPSGDGERSGEPPFCAPKTIWQHPFFRN